MGEPMMKPAPDYRFSLRTLLLVLAIAPPLLWGAWLAFWLMVASRPRTTVEGLMSLLLLALAIGVLAGPVRRAIRRLNAA